MRFYACAGGAVLLDASGRVLVINASAARVWRAMEQGLSDAQAADDLASAFGIAADLALSDTRAVLQLWRAEGLIVGEGQAEPPVVKPRLDLDDVDRVATMLEVEVVRIGSIEMRVSIDAPDLIDRVFRLLQPIAVSSNAPTIGFYIYRSALCPEEMILTRERTALMRSFDPDEIVGGLVRAMLETAHPGSDGPTVLRASAVARGGRVLVLAGSPEGDIDALSGEFTSIGIERTAGDLIAVSAADGLLAPWPTSDARTTSVCAIVFPELTAGDEGGLVPMSPLEALTRVVNGRLWIGYPIDEAALLGLLGWLQSTPAYRLYYSSSHRAAVQLGQLLDDTAESQVAQTDALRPNTTP